MSQSIFKTHVRCLRSSLVFRQLNDVTAWETCLYLLSGVVGGTIVYDYHRIGTAFKDKDCFKTF